MTYARSRLWLGISGVGFIVLLATASLSFHLPHRLLTGRSDASAIALTLLAFILISIPSDLLGGYLLPHRHHRTELTPLTFAAAWLRGVLAQAGILGLSAWLLLQAGRWRGTPAEIACFTLLMILLFAAQSPVAQLVAHFNPKSADPNPTRLPSSAFQTPDPGFVGGLVGFPTPQRLIVPGHWQQHLAPELLHAELTRRQGAILIGARTRGLLIALAWNTLGFSLAANLPGASPGNAPGLIQTALWFTLWSFAGLLTLPSLNRPAVFELDQFALTHGISPQVLAATITHLDTLQDDEPDRTRWIERVFHPIPSASSRIAGLSRPASHFGGWQCARITLYLSWACFGFLARAVHCNAGRPALWVLFPGD